MIIFIGIGIAVLVFFIWGVYEALEKQKDGRTEEQKQKENINVELQDELSKKYFDIMINALRKKDSEKRLYRKGIIDEIIATYDRYGIPFKYEGQLGGKTREQYRNEIYSEFKTEMIFLGGCGSDYNALSEEDFFKKYSLEQIIYNENDNPLFPQLVRSDYLFGKFSSTTFFDEECNVIRTCDLKSCEHYDDSGWGGKCYTCSHYAAYLQYDSTGRCKKFGTLSRTIASRLIAEFVYRATKKELYHRGYSYSDARVPPSKIAKKPDVKKALSFSENHPWMYKDPPSKERQHEIEEKEKETQELRIGLKEGYYILSLMLGIVFLILSIIMGACGGNYRPYVVLTVFTLPVGITVLCLQLYDMRKSSKSTKNKPKDETKNKKD